MACQIIYNNGRVDQVLAPNGQESLLYMDLMLLQAEPSLEKFFQGRSPLELYQQVYTDEFQMWFGDSEFVDQNGEPKVYFHGTNSDFNQFDPTKTVTKGSEYPIFTTGFFFAENKGYSKTYGDKLIPVFLTGKPKQVDTPMYLNVSLDEFYKDQALNSITAIDTGTNERVAVIRHPEQIKSVFNTGLFRDQDRNIYYSMDAKDGTLDPMIEDKLRTFFRINGLDVESVGNISTATGESAAASLDLLNMVVKFVDGKSSQLSEEAAHLLVEMLPAESELLLDLKRKIKSFKTYDTVYQQYSKYPEYWNTDSAGVPIPGDVNENKIAKEAIGQVIAQVINGDVTETKEKQEQAKSFLKRIIQLLRRFLLGKSNEFNNLIAPFAEAKDMILTGYQGNINSSELFYSVPTIQKMIEDALDVKANKILGIRDGKYFTAEDLIKYRVSNIVDRQRAKIFRYATELPEEKKNFLSDKGSISHFYLETLMHNDKITREQLIDKAYAEVNPYLSEVRSKKFYEITDAHFKEYKSAIKSFKEFINSIDPTAIIRTEQMIYDENRDMAGTVDVLIIHSDGRISIFDYKNIENLSYKGQITRQSHKLYERQIGEYKRILTENYPIKGFYKSRIIPIDVKFEGDQFKEIRVGKLEAQDEFLRPLPVGGELSATFDENSKVDRTLARLIRRRDVVGKRLDVEKSDELSIEYNRLNKVIKSLQLYDDYMPIIEDMMRTSRYVLKEVDTFTIEDAKRMNDYLAHLELYEDFIEDFEDIITESLKNEPKSREIKNAINRAVTNSLAARSSIIDRIVTVYNEDSGYNLTEGGRVKSMTAALFDGKDQFNNPLFKYYYSIVQMNRERVRQDLNIIIERISSADEKLRGKFGMAGFDYLIDNDSFIKPYNNEFWEDRTYYKELYKTALEGLDSKNKKVKAEAEADIKEAVTWAKKNLVFNKDKFNAKYDAYKERIQSPISGLTEEEIKKQIKWYESLSPEHDSKAWFESGFVRPNEESMEDKYYTDKWKTAQSIPEVKDYLDSYVEIMNQIREMTDGKLKTPYFMAQIEKDIIDKLTSGGIGIGQLFTKALDVRQNDEAYGLQDEDGKPLKAIPLLFSDPLKGNISNRDKQEITNELLKQGYKEGTSDFELAYEKEALALAYKKGKSMVTTDLTQSLILFSEAALHYKHNNDTLDMALNLRHILTERQQVLQTDSLSRIVRNENSTELVPTAAKNTQTVNQFDHFLDFDFYGIRTTSKDIRHEIFGNQVSLSKFVQGLMNYQSVVALGLNPVASTANFLNAKFNLQFLKSEGIHFNSNQFKASIKGYSEQDEKAVGIQALFEIDSAGTSYEKALSRSASTAKKIFSMRSLMSFHRWADDHVKRAILGAMAQNYVIDTDGKVRSKTGARVKDSSLPSLYDLIEVHEDGSYSIPGLSEKEFARFRAIVLNVANQVTGSMSDDQRAMINSNIWGQMVMKFRTWMPGLVRQRLGGLRYDPLTEELEVGRFKVFAGELLGDGVRSLAKNFLKEAARVAAFGLYKPDVDIETSRKLYNKAKIRNPEMNLDFDEFVKARLAKLNSMAVELRTYLSLALLMQLAILADWDDDDDSFFSKFAFDNLRRIHLEMSFFFEPFESGIQLIKSPIPVAKVLIDLNRMIGNLTVESLEGIGLFPENKRDKTPAGYYVLKQTPVLNHVLEALNVFHRPNKKYLIENVFAK